MARGKVKMKAILINDRHSDLAMDFPYEVEKVFLDGQIKLKESPGRYAGEHFKIINDGKEISLQKAYDILAGKKVRAARVLLHVILFPFWFFMSVVLLGGLGFDVEKWLKR